MQDRNKGRGPFGRALAAGLLVLMLCLLAACGGAPVSSSGPAPAASSSPASRPAEAARSVTILYTSDVHGRIVADVEEGIIGLDTVAGLLAETPDSLLVDAGDFLHGTPTATLSEGEDVVRLMKQAGYIAAAVGNHEFSYGRAVLDARAAQAEAEPDPMPFLSANILTADGQPLFQPYIVVQIGDTSVGVLGLTTADTAFQAAPDAVAGLTFADPVESARAAVEDLRAEGCDIIIALAHLGSDATAPVKGADLAEQVEGLDAVVDAHSHVVLDEVVNGVPVVAAGEYGQNVGRLTLTLDAGGKVAKAENTLLDAAALAGVKPDAALTQEIANMQAAQQELLAEVVGHTLVDLEAEKEVVRTEETNLGNLTADALRWVAGADIGLMNAGCIRATIPAGDITMGQVLEAFPYSNIVVTKSLTGAQLVEVMEHAVNLLPEADGRFMQISGITAEVDAAQPAGSRILKLTLEDGTEVDPAADYLVATNDYIAAGGDDYPVFADLPELTLGQAVEEVFIQYLDEVDLEDYAPGEARRIVYMQ